MLPENAVGACVVVDVVAVDVVTGLLVISRIDYSIVINYIVPNRIGGVVVSVPAASVEDREFEPRLGKSKDDKICILLLRTQH